MWMNLSPSKQENIIKAAVGKIDEFNGLCFSDVDYCYDDSASSKQFSSLSSLERMFKLILSLNNFRAVDKNEFKSTNFEKILEVKKSMGSSNFIWSSIACNIKDSFTLEHFFMNLMIQQLDLLYFKTFVINELEIEHVEEKKKNKRKKHKKKKVKESGCSEKHPEFVTDSDRHIKVSDDTEIGEYKRIDTTNDEINRDYCVSVNKGDKINDEYMTQLINETTPLLNDEDRYNTMDIIYKDEELLETRVIIDNPFYADIESNVTEKTHVEEILFDKFNDKITENNQKQDSDTKTKEVFGYNNDINSKNAGKPQHFNLPEVIINTNQETNNSNTVENKNSANPSNIYNMYPNVDIKPYFNNEPNINYEFDYKSFSFTNFEQNIDNTVNKDQLPSPVTNKDPNPALASKSKEEYRSLSHEKTISTNAESKQKPKNETESEELNIEFETKKLAKTDSDSDNDNTEHDIIEFKPKKHTYNDDYTKNRSTEYNKSNQYHNSKALPSKLGNSNLMLNDLNKIDIKPKKPKLKKINKDTNKRGREKDNQNNTDKNNNNKVIKVKQSEKPKTINQEPKINNKISVQTTKPETNASIKTISYWNDEPLFNEQSANKRNAKDSLATPRLTKNDSDNQSVNNSKKGDKNKLKLKKKGQGIEKPSQLKRKQNINVSTPVQIINKGSKRGSQLNDKQELNDSVDTNIETNTENLTEPEIKTRIKSHFNQTMNSKINEIIDELEDHTQKLELGRKIIHERISTIVYKTFNTETVYVQEYGSYATRLLTPYSDMDLSIQGCLMLDREQAIEMLQVLCDNLKLFGFVRSATSILTALVPVIKIEADPSISFEDSETAPEGMSIKVDIIVDLMDSFNPISTALRTTDYIKYCISNYPSFYKNILFLKFAMNCNDFTNTYKGGLNAYGLCILYVAYIEFYHLEKSIDNFDLLRGFLKFLVTQFSPETQAVYFGTAFR